MAFTRKFLKTLGLTEEQVDSVIEAHTETVEGLKTQMAGYKADAGKLSDVQKELDTLKASGGGEDYKAKYEAEHGAFERYKSEQTAKESAALAERLFREQLTALGITGRRADGIVRLTDLSAVKVEDGHLADEHAVREDIRAEYPEFIPSRRTVGAGPATPPQTTGGRLTKAQIFAIRDAGERQAAIAQNIDLFR